MTGQGPALPSIENIRDAIQAANDRNSSGPHEGIVPFLADEVDVFHQPPFPNDAILERARLAAFLPIEREAMDMAIRDRRLDVALTIEGGNEIVMRGRLTGTFVHDGSRLDKPVHVVWTIDGGKIVRFCVHAESEDSADGYRRQAEAFQSARVKPIYDRMVAAMTTS
jgi:ketosteroid isomerase-like protein